MVGFSDNNYHGAKKILSPALFLPFHLMNSARRRTWIRTRSGDVGAGSATGEGNEMKEEEGGKARSRAASEEDGLGRGGGGRGGW